MSAKIRVNGPWTSRPSATRAHKIVHTWGVNFGDSTDYRVDRTDDRLRISDGRKIDLGMDVEFATALRDALTDLLENYEPAGG